MEGRISHQREVGSENEHLPVRDLGGGNPDSFESEGVVVPNPKLRIGIDFGMTTPTESPATYAESVVPRSSALSVAPVNQVPSLSSFAAAERPG